MIYEVKTEYKKEYNKLIHFVLTIVAMVPISAITLFIHEKYNVATYTGFAAIGQCTLIILISALLIRLLIEIDIKCSKYQYVEIPKGRRK